jgi:hypothetical protein
MCNPMLAVAGASFAISAAQAVSKHQASQQDYNAQNAYADREIARQHQEAYNAEVARNQEFNQIGQRQVQERDAAVQAMVDNQIRAIKAAATAEASAYEHGVEGNSIEAVARNFYREEGRIDASTERNLKMNVNQLQEEKKGSQARYEERASFPEVRRPTNAPSMLGLGLEIAGAAVSSYGMYSKGTSGFGFGGTK